MPNFKSFFLCLIIIQVFSLGIALGTVLAHENATASLDVTEDVNLDQDIQAADLGTDEPRILPDSPFYFLKEWGRKIQFLITFNSVDKIELKQDFTDQKLIELKKLIEQKKSQEVIKKSVESYQNEVESLRATSEKIKDKAKNNQELEKFLDKFTRQQILHQRLLKKLEGHVPLEALEKIQTARERHLEAFGQVMTKLEDRKEKTEERLEKNMEEIKGSRYKNFTNIEILLELEEKVPEAAKDAIRKARETALKRLQEDLGKMSPEDREKFKEYMERVDWVKEKQIEILENLRSQLKERGIDLGEKIIETSDNAKACITLWNPICGKDGKTYSNQCFAKLAGVETAHKGECK